MLVAGTRLHGYEIRAPLGAGGMGEVYLAWDVKLGRKLAIKVLPAEFAADADRGRRFEQEARAASALNHPNVCVVHALGETAEGRPYIAMEYIEGQTLRQVLQTRPPTLKGALDLAIQVAAGLGAAHAVGIVHRDLKPENVIVRPDGLVKVLDFGLAKLAPNGQAVDEATRTLVRTDAGVVMGTYTYMAPEQARGQDVDARADVWALGVMLYELVSGRTPFAGESRSDVIVSILEREPAPLDALNPALPHELQRIVAKALRKDRAQRYQTIADMRLDLEVLRSELPSASGATAPLATSSASSDRALLARRESSAEYLLTGLARHRVAVVAGLLVVGAVMAGAVWRAFRTTAENQVASAARVERHLTRLTFGAGLQTDPTLSPDGRFLAYASDRGGNFDIWVQPVASATPVQVTTDPEPDSQPAWSPDGSSIVFRSERSGGGLFVVPALGGTPRRIASFGERPTWSRNGAEVLFQVGMDVNFGEGAIRFYSVPAEGGSPTQLAAPVLEHGTWKWIAEHPDGRLSAAGTHAEGGTGFYTFSRSGTSVVKSDVSAAPELLRANSLDRFRFIWSRGGTRLYAEGTTNGVFNLWRIDVDPDTLAWRSAEPLTTGGGANINAALSGDETRIAYAQQTFSFRLWSFPFDAATGRVTGEGAAFSEEGVFTGDVDLSSDGAAAVYTVYRPGADGSDIWVHRFAGNHQELLVKNAVTPKWVRGGPGLVFNRWRSDSEFCLMLREPDGTERQLSPWFHKNRELTPTDTTRDGQSVFVSAYAFGPSVPLWLWDADRYSERPQRMLIDRPGTDIWQTQLAPDAQWLAFVVGGGPGRAQVAIARMASGPIAEWTALAPMVPNSDKPRWAPDGRTLYFLSNRQGFWNLAGIRFDPDRGLAVGQPFDVTHFTSPSLTIAPFMARIEIAIAAHRLVLPMMSSTGSIWMLDNVDR